MKFKNYIIILFLFCTFLVNVNAKEVNLKSKALDGENDYTPTKIKNGGFEEYPALDGSDWNTTETETQISAGVRGLFQIIDLNFNRGAYKSSFGIDYANGKFIELNSINHTVLYQNVDTNPGDILLWKLNHAPRNKDNNGNTNQKVFIYIGENGEEQPNLSSPNIRNATIYGAKNIDGKNGYASGDDLKGLLVYEDANWKGNDKIWQTARGLYVVPDNQKSTRFALVTADSNPFGNLVDDVYFETFIGNINVNVSKDSNSFSLTGYYSNIITDKIINYSIVDEKDTVIQNGKIDMTGQGSVNNFIVEFDSKNFNNGTYNIKISNQGYDKAYILKTFTIEKPISTDDIYSNVSKDKFMSKVILLISSISIITVVIVANIMIKKYKEEND